MTVIAWDGQTLAADKRALLGNYKGGTMTKIHRWKGGICGVSGEAKAGMELVSWLQGGADVDDFPELDEDTCVDLLVVHDDGRVAVYEKSPTPLWMEEKHMAIGSGKDYALSALHLGKDAKEAVAFACTMDAFCGNGIDTLELQCI